MAPQFDLQIKSYGKNKVKGEIALTLQDELVSTHVHNLLCLTFPIQKLVHSSISLPL